MLKNTESVKKFVSFVFAFLLMSFANLANANIGKVLLVIGDVKIQRAEVIDAARGAVLVEGDTVITGKNGRAQLLMLDGARIAMKPSTTISLEQYKHSSDESDITGTTESSMTMSVIKGGFRTITGAIAKGEDKSGYKVKTPIATIGIRGTDYEISLTPAAANDQATLAVGVWNGTISVTNSAGSIDVGDTGTHRFAVVLGENVKPEGQNQPPEGIGESSISNAIVASEDIEQVDDEVIEEVAEEEFDPQIPSPDDGEELVPTIVTNSVASSGAFLDGFAGSIETPTDSTTFDGSVLSEFQAIPGQSTFVANNVEHLNVGFDPNSGIAWGRWAGGSISLVGESGQQLESYDLSSQSLHWAFDTAENPTSLPVTGGASYQLVGNTDPTNNLGNTGVLGNATLGVNFTTNVVSSSLALAMNGNVWSASGDGLITGGTSLFSGEYDQVLINGQGGGSGEFAGFFSNLFDSSGLPAGAGLVYTLTDGDIAEIVSGSAIFGNPLSENP